MRDFSKLAKQVDDKEILGVLQDEYNKSFEITLNEVNKTEEANRVERAYDLGFGAGLKAALSANI